LSKLLSDVGNLFPKPNASNRWTFFAANRSRKFSRPLFAAIPSCLYWRYSAVVVRVHLSLHLLHNPGFRGGEPLIGYWIAKPYWNKGICTEALELMIEHIRCMTDIKSLISGHFVDNPASGRVMEKCGFIPT